MVYIDIRAVAKQPVNEALVFGHSVINRYKDRFGKNKGNMEKVRRASWVNVHIIVQYQRSWKKRNRKRDEIR